MIPRRSTVSRRSFARVIGGALALMLLLPVILIAQAQVDNTAPTFTHSPADGATMSSDIGTITVTFSEAVYSDASQTEFTTTKLGQLVTLKKTDASGDNLGFTLSANNLDQNNTRLRFYPSGSYRGLIYVAIGDRINFYDAAGNAGSTDNWTFTYVDPPPAAKDVRVNMTSVVLLEGAPGAWLSVELGQQPSGNVTVALKPSGDANGTDANCASTNAICLDTDSGPPRINESMTFTPQNWDFKQWVTISPYDDTDGRIERITLTLDPSGADYGSAPSTDVSIVVLDDESKRAYASTRSLTLPEGTTDTFTARLSSAPTGNVTVALSSSNPKVTLNPASLSFTTGTWHTAQTVTVRSTVDANTTNELVYLNLNPSGGGYDDARSSTVYVTVNDNGTSGLVLSETSLSLNESGSGNTDSFTVKLAYNPSSDVRVAVGVHTANGKRIATTDKNILTFTEDNGTTAQTVTFTGVADSDDSDDTATVRVVASQATGTFSGVSQEITLDVTDTWSKPGIRLSPESLTITENSSGSYSVSLTKEPSADVTVWLEKSSHIPIATSPQTLTFTRTNYATSQTLTLHAGEISGSSDWFLIQLRAEGGGYDNIRTPLHTVRVNGSSDTKHIQASRGGSPVYQLSAGPGAVAVGVRLSAQPTSNVTMTVAGAPSGEVSFWFGNNNTRTFTSQNWATPQTLRINISEDADTIDDRILITLTAAGSSDYAGKTRHIELIKVDGDQPANEKPPTATVGTPGADNAVTVTFNKAVGVCSTKTDTSAAETYCSGSVAAFTSTTVASTLELVVGVFDVDYDPPAGVTRGSPVTYTTSISGNVVTITPTGITQTGTDIPIIGSVKTLNLLVKDRYWSVDGGVIGSTVLKQLAVQGRQRGNNPPPPPPSATPEPPPPPIPEILGALLPGSDSDLDNGDEGETPYEPPVQVDATPEPTPEPTPAPTPTPTPQPESDDPFDGQVFEIRHVTADSTSCLDVSYGRKSNGQVVWMWDCNDTTAQKWRFVKRTSGDFAGTYRLVSSLSVDSHCLDNHGDFVTSSRMVVWQCLEDDHTDAANQSVTIDAARDGYTITFTNGNGVSVWLATGRAADSVVGDAYQEVVSGSPPTTAIWQIVPTTDY